jgi:hypothetical protein
VRIDNIFGDLEGGVASRYASNLFEMKESKKLIWKTQEDVEASLTAHNLNDDVS